jgi:hypothetical protein
MGKVEYRIIGDVAIGSLLFKGTLLEFVVDSADLEKIRPYKWHYASNAYIATTIYSKVEDVSGLPLQPQQLPLQPKKKELYLHNLLTSPKPGWSVSHITKNGLDNRRKNLRLTFGPVVHDVAKQRTVELPALCGVKPEDIPKHIWYVQANGYHRDRFAIEFKTENILWKSTSSKDFTLLEKLEQAKKKLEELYVTYPYLDPKREEDLCKELTESFDAIFQTAKV